MMRRKQMIRRLSEVLILLNAIYTSVTPAQFRNV